MGRERCETEGARMMWIQFLSQHEVVGEVAVMAADSQSMAAPASLSGFYCS